MSMNCKDPVALLEVRVTKLGRPSDYWVRAEFLTFIIFCMEPPAIHQC